MEHILKKSHEELENIHNLVANYRISSIREFVFSLFWNSFKKTLFKYAAKKEEILMNYSSLYSDMSKDIHDSHAKPTDIEHVKDSLLYITKTIEECGNLLEQLVAHSHKQEEVVEHEKKFFVHLLESFNKDLLDWVGSHEKEVFWEITQLTKQQWKTSLESGKALLELQKKRLESHINNISSIK